MRLVYHCIISNSSLRCNRCKLSICFPSIFLDCFLSLSPRLFSFFKLIFHLIYPYIWFPKKLNSPIFFGGWNFFNANLGIKDWSPSYADLRIKSCHRGYRDQSLYIRAIAIALKRFHTDSNVFLPFIHNSLDCLLVILPKFYQRMDILCFD